ncbi:Dolichyl-phosphate-mannose-protein mannosyltransferase-domain-containing protein [Chytriomyces sp. MP71]|nr:Dolichyl-phosphate-mannose-protein mannosyltransferase-domain-containing protein [Chytriomyces sp. MP71]
MIPLAILNRTVSAEHSYVQVTDDGNESEDGEENLKRIAEPSHVRRTTAAALMFTALLLRIHSISHPKFVVFDEWYFVRFASNYVEGRWFFDVHPPLGKLLFGLVARLFGSTSAFAPSQPGTAFGPHAPFVAMRSFSAIVGSLLAPVSYATCKLLGLRGTSSVLVAGLIVMDNALVAQSRLILLDSSLILCIALAMMSWARFLSVQEYPFGHNWWLSLAVTGLLLGFTISVKSVGLFLIATVGLATIHNLIRLLITDEMYKKPREFLQHFMARVLCLIILPISVYVAAFWVHFRTLPQTSPDAGYMSPEFQATLKGQKIVEPFVDVLIGSFISLKNADTGCGYLSSNPVRYPTGSKGQLIACYSFDDSNAMFMIERPFESYLNGNSSVNDALPYIHDGDRLRLIHTTTKTRLHSDDFRPPLSGDPNMYEVSGFGVPSSEDSNDLWRIELLDPSNAESGRIATRMHFRLIHVNLGCRLTSPRHSRLPEWGFGQAEVACTGENSTNLGTTWFIESNRNPNLPLSSPKIHYKQPGFWSKFFEIHKRMWQVNDSFAGAALPNGSRPLEWPFLATVLRFWRSKYRNRVDSVEMIYLIGNPLVWWTAGVSIIFSFIYALSSSILWLIGYGLFLEDEVFAKAWTISQLIASGWFLHYAPFFLMDRVLYLHHYLPALYFSILSVGVSFDVATRKTSNQSRQIICGIVLVVVFLGFVDFSPLSYGGSGC